MKVLVLSILALLLAGCATETAYQAADRRGGVGYTDMQLGENRYRVVFTGNYSTSAETVRDYALLRAAELTLETGHDWFRLADRDGDKRSRSRVTGGGVSHFHRGYYGPYWGVGAGTSTVQTQDSHSYFLEFIVGSGELDEEDPGVYDARETALAIRRHLGHY